MQPIATDVARSMVCLSVCVGHLGELCKNGWTDQKWLHWSRCCLGADSCGSKEPSIRWWSISPTV